MLSQQLPLVPFVAEKHWISLPAAACYNIDMPQCCHLWQWAIALNWSVIFFRGKVYGNNYWGVAAPSDLRIWDLSTERKWELLFWTVCNKKSCLINLQITVWLHTPSWSLSLLVPGSRKERAALTWSSATWISSNSSFPTLLNTALTASCLLSQTQVCLVLP